MIPALPSQALRLPTRKSRLSFGSADAAIRIRAINPLKNREEWDKSVELQGTLAELRERLETLTAAGYNGYLIPQPHRPPSGTQIADADVTGINCLFTDGDETDLPAEWHLPPSFILIHPTTGRWWAFWLVNKETFPLADFDPMQKRITANYGSDPRVCNPGRIVRLAGFDRWKKGENFAPTTSSRARWIRLSIFSTWDFQRCLASPAPRALTG
jgi:hypothetical protein